MSSVDSNKVIQHLRLKWHGRGCPMCNSGPWNVQETMYELREFHGGAFVVGGVPIIPVVPVICQNCGHTVLVNAIQAGAVSPDTKQPS